MFDNGDEFSFRNIIVEAKADGENPPEGINICFLDFTVSQHQNGPVL